MGTLLIVVSYFLLAIIFVSELFIFDREWHDEDSSKPFVLIFATFFMGTLVAMVIGVNLCIGDSNPGNILFGVIFLGGFISRYLIG